MATESKHLGSGLPRELSVAIGDPDRSLGEVVLTFPKTGTKLRPHNMQPTGTVNVNRMLAGGTQMGIRWTNCG